MHSKRDNIEIMMNYKADEIIEELFDSLKNIYQNNLQSMKGSEFVLNYVKLFYYKCHKIYPHCCGSYIDSPDWIENKTATILSIKKKKMFSIHCNSRIKSSRNRRKQDKPFINNYKWERINFPSETDDWEKLRKIM